MPAPRLKQLSLAVVSDLHIGEGARSADLSPHAGHKSLENDFRRRFASFVKKEGIRPDYLIVPGDASHRGAPAELALASNIILECADALQLKPESILYVPGNHDADWTVFEHDDPTGFRREQKYAPLRNPAWLFEAIIRRAKQHLLDPHYFSIWEYPNLLAVGYNSAWHDDAITQVHHGLIANDHLAQLGSQLACLEYPASQLRVFVVHHHPVGYSDPTSDEPDFSAMQNAPRLLDLLRTYHFDLVVHGHRHQPYFQTVSVKSDYPLAILSAGSFSAQIHSRWNGLVNNQFHLVNVEGRSSSSGLIFGDVRSWTYLSDHGWVESQNHNGIAHVCPFGTYLLPGDLRKALRRIIGDHFTSSPTDYMHWSEIVVKLPKLKYLQRGTVKAALESLSEELSFAVEDTASAGLILLKEHTKP